MTPEEKIRLAFKDELEKMHIPTIEFPLTRTFREEMERIKTYPNMPPHRKSLRLARLWLNDKAYGSRKKRLTMAILYCLKALFQNDKY